MFLENCVVGMGAVVMKSIDKIVMAIAAVPIKIVKEKIGMEKEYRY